MAPQGNAPAPKIYLEFLKPSEIKAYKPPQNAVLVGEKHIVRGNFCVIGGAPGVGKSRAAVALAEAGAHGYNWFGLRVHCKFKTLIIQSENGRFRLKDEFADLDETVMDQFVRITPPPPFGLYFQSSDFRSQLKSYINGFKPDVVIFDPWSAIAQDQSAADYRQAFELIRRVVPPGDTGAAIVIVAHVHKPQRGERADGRALLNLLSGSLMLGSVPRTVWVLQSASDDVGEQRVIYTCCKNNDGPLGPQTCWKRDNGQWTEVTDFDWQDWQDTKIGNGKNGSHGTPITEQQMAYVFRNGPLSRKDAVQALKDLTAKGRSQCYDATNIKGRFSAHLSWNKRTGEIQWI